MQNPATKANIKAICLGNPLGVAFGEIIRFAEGKGVLIPAEGENKAFHELRKMVLAGIVEPPRAHQPHITLMHPRNSTCTNEIFARLKQYSLPTKLYFNRISWIEQKAGGKWNILQEFRITGKNES